MTRQEQIDIIRTKTPVSREEANEALDKTQGELLSALLLLEKNQRESLGNQTATTLKEHSQNPSQGQDNSFQSLLRLVNTSAHSEIWLHKPQVLTKTLPLPLFILFLLFFPWVTLGLTALGLVLGYTYTFEGKV